MKEVEMAPKVVSPYLRIAADLRRRITAGELAPGDRVPSTRQLAREWGVALATATKALTALHQEGLVRAQPRVGTVVASPGSAGPVRTRPASPDSEQELTRERVVRAAIELADAEGLAALSMRGVAARLGVATMSPYHHVQSKEDLVLRMADAAFGELGYPEPPPEGWRARLELGGRTLWAVYRRHPWLAQLSPLGRPLLLPGLMVHAEWALSALDGLGLDSTTLLNLHIVAYTYVQGLATNLEREAQAVADTGLSETQWMAAHEPALGAIAASGRYPTFATVTGGLPPGGYELDLDALFELGQRSLLDGFALLIEQKQGAAR